MRYWTTLDDNHKHMWSEDSEWASESSGHKHPVESGRVLIADGHTHTLTKEPVAEEHIELEKDNTTMKMLVVIGVAFILLYIISKSRRIEENEQ